MSDLDLPSGSPDPISTATVTLVTDIFACHLIPVMSAFGLVGNILNVVVFGLQKRGEAEHFLFSFFFIIFYYFFFFNSWA
jgi:hypothetical protein